MTNLRNVGPARTSPDASATKKDIDDASATAVHVTGNETVAGVKTFSSSPVVPEPTLNSQTSTKFYTDTTATTKANGAKDYTDIQVATRVANATGQTLTLWTGTQAAYVALGTWDASTLYVVV